MATRTVSATSDSLTSGADGGLLTDANALTLGAVALGGITVGGSLFIGAAVAPSQVIGGALLASTLAVGGEVKNRTGSYLPFLDKKDEEKKADAPAAA